MPNTGKPSLDCHLCRARRVKVSVYSSYLQFLALLGSPTRTPLCLETCLVPSLSSFVLLMLPAWGKCDLTKPGCLRCTKYGAICPGYRGQLDAVFHNENPSSIQQKRRRRPQQSPSPPGGATRNVSPAASLQSFTSVDSSIDIDPRFAILSPATFDLQLSAPRHSRSITLILDQFVNILNGQRAYDWLDFLPSVFQETPDNSCLGRAADLFATAHTSQLLHDTSNEMQVKRQYGQTLQSIKTALADPFKRLEDTTLIAIWLLGHYEVSQPPRPPPRGEYVPFLAGKTQLT